MNEDAFEPEKPVGEECGVFGVWPQAGDVAKVPNYGLTGFKNRGREAAGRAGRDAAGRAV